MLKKILKSYDYSLIFVIVMLAVFGLIMVYSASMVNAIQRYGYESDHFYVRQRVFLLIGAGLFLFFAIMPYKIMLSNKVLMPLAGGTLLILALLFVFGHTVNGATSWYKIGGFSLQPAEFAKVSVIVYLAAVYAKKQSYIHDFNKGVAPPLAFLVIVFALIASQPDYGTAAIIVATAATIVFCSGMSFKHIARFLFIVACFLIPISLLMFDEIFSSVRLGRFASFMNPFAEEIVQKEGYNMANSFIAIGAGGIKGLGLGQSVQKLGYLPEPHTDFIMAVIAEELGLLGVGFVLLSLGFIVLKGIFIALKGKDSFGSLLAIGISSLVGIQSFVNLAGISGVIPLTGVPLPFISYGGSSILQLSIAMGILVNVSMFVKYDQKFKNNNEDKETSKSPLKNRGNLYSIKK